MQVEENAKLRAQNEEVLREYRQRQRAQVPSPEEQEAERTTADFYAILAEDEAVEDPDRTTIDSTSFCELMSEEARAQTIHYARVSSHIDQEWDCETAVELLTIRSKRADGFEGAQRAEVVGINAEGDRATATVRFGPKGAATSVALVKEGGEWKLAATTLGE